ncbi:hypothetical protein [Francisella frigiditurris]|uniref:Uncharacterized protein n=1 Tax=Francisella frigiditurris TaxID=1542390 RepID=A0A1J0KW87_9GAMM|nr:hypothetical protein [Francisella frigiditurris]APC97946.1 hypothetical protein KX01_464 [Francisella frigiditurris]
MKKVSKIGLIMAMFVGGIGFVFAADDTNVTSVAQQVNVDQEKTLVGNNPATQTPGYLSVKGFKKCLQVENMRGWSGYCMPESRPEKCPKDSWKELSKINIVDCSKEAKEKKSSWF